MIQPFEQLEKREKWLGSLAYGSWFSNARRTRRSSGQLRIFAAFCFFPPENDPNGNIAYKLVRNSCNHYDVCSSRNLLRFPWAYLGKETKLSADNIDVYTVDAPHNATEWSDKTLTVFEKLSKKDSYDAIMTWFNPVESIEFAKALSERGLEIPWIAYVADPIACNPPVMDFAILKKEGLSDDEKQTLIEAIHGKRNGQEVPRAVLDAPYFEPVHADMIRRIELEAYMIDNADGIAFQNKSLMEYVLAGRKTRNATVIRQAGDSSLVSLRKESLSDSDSGSATQFVYIGSVDANRSLDTLIKAMKLVQQENSSSESLFELHIYGNIADEVKDQIRSLGLEESIFFQGTVDYDKALEIMQQADWLVHTEESSAYLKFYGKTPVCLPSKITDYFSTANPVLSFAGSGSPAHGAVQQAGGKVIEPDDVESTIEFLRDVAAGIFQPAINLEYRRSCDARVVAAEFDDWINAIARGRR
jgi:glycosyltransferase involved in cell wall biosynthesis